MALTLVGGLIAVGAALLQRGSPGAGSKPAGKLAFSHPEYSDIVVAEADGSHLRRLTSTAGHRQRDDPAGVEREANASKRSAIQPSSVAGT